MSGPAESGSALRCAHLVRNPAVSDRSAAMTHIYSGRGALGDYRSASPTLHHWAKIEPNRIFMAERDRGRLAADSFAQLFTSSRRIASAWWRAGCRRKADVILSGNSVDHALIGSAALYAASRFVRYAGLFAGAGGLRQDRFR